MQRFATAIIMNSSLLLFPLFVTAFGDIITWEENEFVRTFHIENKQKYWNIADFREILLGIFNVNISEWGESGAKITNDS